MISNLWLVLSLKSNLCFLKWWATWLCNSPTWSGWTPQPWSGCSSASDFRLKGNNSWESHWASRVPRGFGFSGFQAGLQMALGNSLNLCDICFVPDMLKSVSPEPTSELLCVCVCVCECAHTHTQSCPTVTPWTMVMGTIASLHCLWDSPGKNTGVGCHALLQGIFPAQGLNPYLLHWQLASLPRATWEALLQRLDLHNP